MKASIRLPPVSATRMASPCGRSCDVTWAMASKRFAERNDLWSSAAAVGGSEADGAGHLKRISLVGGAIAELLEEPDAGVESVIRKDQVRHEPERVDGVPLAGLLSGDRRSRFRRRLALLIAREADLQARRARCERERPE